jgi:hypothetical protein
MFSLMKDVYFEWVDRGYVMMNILYVLFCSFKSHTQFERTNSTPNSQLKHHLIVELSMARAGPNTSPVFPKNRSVGSNQRSPLFLLSSSLLSPFHPISPLHTPTLIHPTTLSHHIEIPPQVLNCTIRNKIRFISTP